MRRVQQKGERDCGVAALAILAERSYQEALEYLQEEGFKTRGVKAHAIIKGLAYFGRKPLRQRSVRMGNIDVTDIEHDALLSCFMWEDGKRYGHWAVWCSSKQKILDPYASKQKLQVRTYLPVD